MFKLLALAALSSAQGLESITPAKGPFTEIPILGFGTYLINNAQNASATVISAIQTGYRHIDTAAIYQNQKLLAPGIAEGIKKAGIRREDFWVTSKLWNSRYVWAQTD
jgi:diketogulonate reductase-like aldo/keto reductase